MIPDDRHQLMADTRATWDALRRAEVALAQELLFDVPADPWEVAQAVNEAQRSISRLAHQLEDHRR